MKKAAKGNVLTSTDVGAMRAGDAEISTHLMRTLENNLPVDVAVIPFYGNISMQKTGALFQNADAVVRYIYLTENQKEVIIYTFTTPPVPSLRTYPKGTILPAPCRFLPPLTLLTSIDGSTRSTLRPLCSL